MQRNRCLALLRSCFSLAFTVLTLGSTARAEVRLPHILSDHAVLQRDMPIHLWGWAAPGETVAVDFHGQKAGTAADTLGRWSVYLAPEKAGGPYTLTVQASNTLTLTDILVGDVWFASGQSNMEMPLSGFPGTAVLKNGPQEIAAANEPRLHLLRFPHAASAYEQRDIDAVWTVCTPETAKNFSAVAYFFGRALARQEKVPFGLIDSSWGGTPIASWLSLDALSADSSLAGEFAARVPMVEAQADVPAMLAEEQREDREAQGAGKPLPKHPFHPDPASYEPAALFNGMVAPALEYPIKGVLWYQGETDSAPERRLLYERAFPAMITGWRARWREGSFPFLFVQLSSFGSTAAEGWGTVREAQRRTLALASTAMAVTLDVGDANNVHPPDKQSVGARLALGARAVAYGEPVEWSGPMFRQAVPEGGALRVYFDHVAGLSAQTGALGGFEVAAGDRHFHPADAELGTGRYTGTVLLRASGVEHPVYVRYGWANAPVGANLMNGAGLPAATFTSELHLSPP